MTNLFAGATGGPNGIGGTPANVWFDGNTSGTAGAVAGGFASTWDCGAAVAVDSVRIYWSFGSPGPYAGGGAAGAFAIDTGTTATGPWTEVVTGDEGGRPYPGDFSATYPIGATSRYWRFRSTTSNNNDIFEIVAEAAPPPDVLDPYEYPPPGRAIVEIYVAPDGFASRWGTALWGDTDFWSSAGWVDISPWCVSADVSWGADRSELGILADQSAGKWVISTYDPERVLDPANADSQFYPSLVPGLPIRVNHDGVTIRTGKVTRISYAHKAEGGIINASDAIAEMAAAEVPSDSILSDTLRERAVDAIAAAGLSVPVQMGPNSPELAPLEEAERSVWAVVSGGARERHRIPWIDNTGTVRFWQWTSTFDRGRVLASPELVDLEDWASDDGLISVVRVNDVDDGMIERARTPTPRYGKRVHTRSEPTILGSEWAIAVLDDRADPQLRWRPGEIRPLNASSVTHLGDLHIGEHIRLEYTEADPSIVVIARILGIRFRAVDETPNLDTGIIRTRWRFWLVTTDALDSPLAPDGGDDDDYLTDEADAEYLYEDGVS